MTTFDEQLHELRQDVDAHRASLRHLEKDTRKEQPKDVWDKIQALSGLFSALLTAATVVIVGWYLTDSVKLSIEKRRLQLENVKEMQDILRKLPTANREEARASALTLAVFGEPAIGPLILLLDDGQQVPAAQAGLRAVGIGSPEPVCAGLIGVVGNRSRLYRWGTHQIALRLLGELGCPNAKGAVAEYARLLAGISTEADLAKYHAVVSDEPTLGNVRDIIEDLVKVQTILR